MKTRTPGAKTWGFLLPQNCVQLFSYTLYVYYSSPFVCLYTYEFWLSLCKIVRSSLILLLPLFIENNFSNPFRCHCIILQLSICGTGVKFAVVHQSRMCIITLQFYLTPVSYIWNIFTYIHMLLIYVMLSKGFKNTNNN